MIVFFSVKHFRNINKFLKCKNMYKMKERILNNIYKLIVES